MFDYNLNPAYQVFRGIKYASTTDGETDKTTIPDAAFAFSEKNKTSLTTALEDFSEKFKDFHGQDSSNISASDAKKGGFTGFLEKIGLKKETYGNMFETPKMQEYMENENVFQMDIFEQSNAAEGGLRYAQKDDDMYEAALNFAKADIEAIEKAYYKANPLDDNPNGSLDTKEINSYTNVDSLYNYDKYLDLDDNPDEISPKEYAAFLIAADGLSKTSSKSEAVYNSLSADGLITSEESAVTKNLSDVELQMYAQKIYNAHYKDKK